MPETVDNKKIFSLSEVLKSIEATLMKRYTSSFWVKAEMNKLNYYNHSGHCYPDLVEKSGGKIVAEMRGVLWSGDYQRVNGNFLNTLKEPLKDGIKILMNVKIEFKSKYGLTLHILDIDPSYTLGDLEKEKQETILRLKGEELFFKNRALPMPVLPQRIAVISVETSKGYSDFKHVLDDNPWGYHFSYLLFPSLLQGDAAVDTMINQLNRIRKVIQCFDVVAIIRGGGGEVGLSCYNNYRLVRAVCEFPIPVLTGIGHSTNTTVIEMVAHTNAITPTKVGENLLQYFHNFNIPVENAKEKLIEYAANLLNEKKESFGSIVNLFKLLSGQAVNTKKIEVSYLEEGIGRLTRVKIDEAKRSLKLLGNNMMLFAKQATYSEEIEVRHIAERIKKEMKMFVQREGQMIETIEKNIRLVHPENVLKRGYSITLVGGKPLTDTTEVKKGEEIITLLAKGKLTSKIITKES